MAILKGIARRTKYNRPATSGTGEIVQPSYYASSSSNVLWKWNETDTSCLSSTITLRTTALGELNITNFTQTFVDAAASGGVGPRIRHTFTFGGGNGGAFIFNFKNGSTDMTVPDRFIFRFRLAEATNIKTGIMVWNNNLSDPWGFGLCNGRAGTTTTEPGQLAGASPTGLDDPFLLPANTAGGVDPEDNVAGSSQGAIIEYTVANVPATASTTPYPTCHMQFLGTNFSGSSRLIRSHGTSQSFLGTAPAAGWTNKTGLNTLALFFIQYAPPGASATVDISDMMILRHPMDWV